MEAAWLNGVAFGAEQIRIDPQISQIHADWKRF